MSISDRFHVYITDGGGGQQMYTDCDGGTELLHLRKSCKTEIA